MKISERLKKVREYLGLTQKDLADKLGFPWHKIKNIETEKHKLTSEIAENIEQFYSISGWWLLTGKGEMLLSDTKSEPSQKAKPRTIIDAKDILKHHISDTELELLQDYRSLPKHIQEAMYYMMKSKKAEHPNEGDIKDAKYA